MIESLSFAALALAGLALLLLFLAAPLMLYAIHHRLGETNRLLRHLAGPPTPAPAAHKKSAVTTLFS